MSRPSLEDAIREMAARGEITHLSLTPRGKNWGASFSPASSMGNAFGEDKDPVEAIFQAFEEIKLRRPRKLHVDKPTDPHLPTAEVAAPPTDVSVAPPADDLADILG